MFSMVLEQIFKTKDLLNKPHLSFYASFAFVSSAILIALVLQIKDSGMFIVALSSLPAVVLFLRTIFAEEHFIEKKCSTIRVLDCYKPLISVYFWFFIGTTLAFALWSSILPQNLSNDMFSEQKLTYARMGITGNLTANFSFNEILINNAKILFMLMILSFLYGAGSIFLLIWNASVLGVFIGTSISSNMAMFSAIGPLAYGGAFIYGFLISFLRILPHGMFEIGGFFTASIAGGLLSVVVENASEKKQYLGREYKKVYKDILITFVFAMVLILLGAVVESSY